MVYDSTAGGVSEGALQPVKAQIMTGVIELIHMRLDLLRARIEASSSRRSSANGGGRIKGDVVRWRRIRGAYWHAERIAGQNRHFPVMFNDHIEKRVFKGDVISKGAISRRIKSPKIETAVVSNAWQSCH